VAELTVIRWRDIPAQVTASNGDATARRELPDRFQRAIDAAAMKAGLIESDAYLEGWRRDTRPCGEQLEAEVEAETERLEAAYDRVALLRLTRSGGLAGD
jgi:hypothetical protein